MKDAYVNVDSLDVQRANFTKRRGARNEVALCFQQAVATPAGQTLSIFLPEGFRILWSEAGPCLEVDPALGTPRLEVDEPFGDSAVDPAKFAPMPRNIFCSASADGATVYLALESGLPETNRYYALRLRGVRNADRNPAPPPLNEARAAGAIAAELSQTASWRLQLGRQATPPIPGFAVQAFLRLEVATSVSSLSRSSAEGTIQGPPNMVRLVFQPSVTVPPGGALVLVPPQEGGRRSFQLVAAKPRKARGILLRRQSRCSGASVFLGAGYTYKQCEETCRLRGSCTYFRVGFGTRRGACIQEGTGLEPVEEVCQEFVPDNFFNVYRITPTGNCYRFELLDSSGEALPDVDCVLEEASESGGKGRFLFSLSMEAKPLQPSGTYTAVLGVRNPSEAPQLNSWSVMSYSDMSLSSESLLDEGILDSFSMTKALAYFDWSLEPQMLMHEPGANLVVTIFFANSLDMQRGIDLIFLEVPSWFELSPDVCSSLEAVHAGTALTDCSRTTSGISAIIGGGEAVVRAGERLDFRFAARNPNSSVVLASPRDVLSLVSLTQFRPTISVLTGLEELVPMASSAALSHVVQLPLLGVTIRQTTPRFAIAGQRPVALQIDFQLQSSGANQVWVVASPENPLDFSETRCAVTSSNLHNGSAALPELFGIFACHASGMVVLPGGGRHLPELRVDAGTTLAAGVRFRLALEGVGAAPQPGSVAVTIVSSVAERTADYTKFSEAAVLDSTTLGGGGVSSTSSSATASNADEDLRLIGRLALRPMGQGSFASLTKAAEFGAEVFVAGDHVQLLTLAFEVQVPIESGHFVIIYPSPRITVVDSPVTLTLEDRSAPCTSRIRSVGSSDDAFAHPSAAKLGFRQRVDITVDAASGIPAGELAALQFYVRVPLVMPGTDLTATWLVVSARETTWSSGRGVVSNSNQQEWSGGAVRAIPAFDPRASMLRVDNRFGSRTGEVVLLLAPTAPVQMGATLRLSAPNLFVWSSDCVTSTAPLDLVKLDSCIISGQEPHKLYIELDASMDVGIVHELSLRITTPPMARPPNMWEVAVLGLPADKALEADGADDSAYDSIQQIFRFPGYGLVDMEGFLEPQVASGPMASALADVDGVLLLLTFQVAPRLWIHGDEEGQLLSTEAALMLRLEAPFPLVADCPLPDVNEAQSMRGQAWDAWRDGNKQAVDYGNAGAWFDLGWLDDQLLSLHQRPQIVLHCSREGRRDASNSDASSSILIKFGTSIPPGQWVAVPVVARLPPVGTQSDTSANNSSSELSTPLMFWRARLLSGVNEEVVAATDIIRARPEDLLPPRKPVMNAATSGNGTCVVGELCISLAGDLDGLLPPMGLQLDEGFGVPVRLNFNLPRVLMATPFVPTQRFQEIFGSLDSATQFPARIALGSYVEVVAPAPLRWSPQCHIEVANSVQDDRAWDALCVGSTAFISTTRAGVQGAISLLLSNITLYDPASMDSPLLLPLSSSWVVSLVDEGVLRNQQIVRADPDVGVAKIPSQKEELLKRLIELAEREREEEKEKEQLPILPVKTDANNGSNGSNVSNETFVIEDRSWVAEAIKALQEKPTADVKLDVDATVECSNSTLLTFACPFGMYATGILGSRLGGADSWMDSMQLRCIEELDVGAGHTERVVRVSATPVVGDIRYETRKQELEAGAQVDELRCDGRDSSLLVGGRIEAWRSRRILGLSATCMAWSNVERQVPWGPNVRKNVYPSGVNRPDEDKAVASNADSVSDTDDPASDTMDCSGDAPIAGSALWAICDDLPYMRMCPRDPGFCCCEPGSNYREALRRCEPCREEGWTGKAPWRVCPTGSAVVGMRAAVLQGGDEVGMGGADSTGRASAAAVDPMAEPLSVCAVELVCAPLLPRRFAGPKAIPDEEIIDTTEEDLGVGSEEEEDDGVPSIPFLGKLSFENLQWYHYLIGSLIVLGTLRLVYMLLCQNRQVEVIYGDEEGSGTPLHRRLYAKAKRYVLTIWRFYYKYLWTPLKNHVLVPFKEYVEETRLFKAFLRFMAWLERKCPCIFRCVRGFGRLIKRLWAKHSGKALASGGTPRRMMAEFKAKLARGDLSPASIKRELARMQRDGQLSPKFLADQAVRAVSPRGGFKKAYKEGRLKTWCCPCFKRDKAPPRLAFDKDVADSLASAAEAAAADAAARAAAAAAADADDDDAAAAAGADEEAEEVDDHEEGEEEEDEGILGPEVDDAALWGEDENESGESGVSDLNKSEESEGEG
eukprot:TRINITY_DN24534_c0_g2_i1.p1 TRINITY_DN24534_c0_g2~~TRINITY_DN24534_c0_g2_i1.p1  ORF type:complete len:2249 (+),score=409.68 TRINITY_DN24534_c0_g2_i1:57-6749(+)